VTLYSLFRFVFSPLAFCCSVPHQEEKKIFPNKIPQRKERKKEEEDLRLLFGLAERASSSSSSFLHWLFRIVVSPSWKRWEWSAHNDSFFFSFFFFLLPPWKREFKKVKKSKKKAKALKKKKRIELPSLSKHFSFFILHREQRNLKHENNKFFFSFHYWVILSWPRQPENSFFFHPPPPKTKNNSPFTFPYLFRTFHPKKEFPLVTLPILSRERKRLFYFLLFPFAATQRRLLNQRTLSFDTYLL